MNYNKIRISGLLPLLVMLVSMAGFMSCSDDNEVYNGPADLKVTATATGEPVTALEFNTYGGSVMITVESDAPWQISVAGAPEWLKLSNTSGEATKDVEPRYIKVTAEPLGDADTRSCTITVKSGSAVCDIAVTQEKSGVTDADGWETAVAANNNMCVGVNLFNTLDANGDWFDPDDIVACETCWGQPLAKQEWFDAVAASGFKVVRVPVTWFPHFDENRMVKEPWMNRVQEVVNYAMNAGLYCILNVHHDTGAHDNGWVCADYANIDDVCNKVEHLWKQIAERFRDYGEKLIFEGYNEMLDPSHSWIIPTDPNVYKAVNMIAQRFVDTVRATGGNNRNRNLIVSTYGCDGGKLPLSSLELPVDEIPGHIMVQVHNYTPYGFSNLMNDIDDDNLPTWTPEFQKELADMLDHSIEFAKATGVPIVVGECGAYDKIDEAERAKYGEFISTYAKGKAPMTVIFWGQLIDRNTCEELYPLFIDGFLKGIEY